MTASTQSLTAQGLTGAGIPIQQGPVGPGFALPVSEQILGMQQPYGFPAPFGLGAAVGTPSPYAQVSGTALGSGPPIPHAPLGTPFVPGPMPVTPTPIAPQVQQAAYAIASQIIPAAQQAILPLAIGAVQQLTLLVAQLAVTHLAAQQAAWPWQQAAWQPMTGYVGQASRPGYQPFQY
jgi:hypothetical protein